MKRTSWMIYECLALVIVLITGIDVWWSIALADTLYQNELNPIACWVLAAGQPESSVSSYAGVAWLCALKVVCAIRRDCFPAMAGLVYLSRSLTPIGGHGILRVLISKDFFMEKPWTI